MPVNTLSPSSRRPWPTFSQVRAALQLHRETIHRLREAGWLRATPVAVGAREVWQFDPEDLARVGKVRGGMGERPGYENLVSALEGEYGAPTP